MDALQAAIMRARSDTRVILRTLPPKITAPPKVVEPIQPRPISRWEPKPQNQLVTEVIIGLALEPRRPKIPEIQILVADAYGLTRDDLLSPRRTRNFARPRQIAMYLAKVMTALSLPQIGRQFANRDHTTIMHAVWKVEQLMAANPAFAQQVNDLRSRLG